MDEQVHDYTELTSFHDLYKFTRMSFRLRNGLMNFRRALDVLLASVGFQLFLLLLNDIAFLFEVPQNHIERVGRMLKLLYIAEATLKLLKCKLFVEFL